MVSPDRLEIFEIFAQVERTMESMAAETGLSAANASPHLQQLRQAQMMSARREALFVPPIDISQKSIALPTFSASVTARSCGGWPGRQVHTADK
jgi:hypothetical protein